MKRYNKLLGLLFMMFFISLSAFTQSTEVFEDDVIGATTFTDNGQTFIITNGAGETNYDIETFSGGGWNGSAPDNNFIDNSGTPNPPLNNGSSFTITTSGGTDIYVNSLYLFISQFNLTAASSFSLTIQARKNGVVQYTIVKTTGFSNTTTFTPNNGFTFINFATEGGSDNSNTAVDEFLIATTGNADYIALDAMNWEFAPVCNQPSIPAVTAVSPICAGGSTTLNIAGSLNDATQWHIYTGFCGVTPVGTTTGSTFVVSPTVTTTYYVRGQGGCTTPGTCGARNIVVSAAQNASFSYSASSYCANVSDPTPTITGVSGGTFTSTGGLSLNASTGGIDVSASTPGAYTITYTTPGPCPGTSTQNVTINALDNASFSYSASSYCSNGSDPTPTITGLTGGTFSSGAGLALNTGTGAIDLSASTPGTYSVTYTTAGACPNSSSVSVTINTVDNASFSYSASAYCVNASDPTPTITGVTGGTFTSGAGLAINASTGAIDVSASTPGTYTVSYTTSGSCANSSSVSVTVNALDNASFSYSASSYCASASDPTPTITGLTGGTFSSGAGLAINTGTGAIDVSVSTPGTYTVTYTTSGACPNSSSVSVTINTVDNASFSYSASTYCVSASDPTPTITGVTGGTFTSNAGLVINAGTGTIDVSVSTPGLYTVTYTTSGACPNTSSVSVSITSLDDASFSYAASTYCQGQADPSPTITGVTGGTFTSSPAGLSIVPTTGFVNIITSTPGTYTITYTTTGSCSNSSNVSLTISTPPAPPSVVTPVSGCPGTTVNLTATGSGTGAILFYDNVPTLIGTVPMPPATATFTTGTLAAGTYAFQVTESNGGCQSLPATITVDMSDATPPTAVCQDITIYLDATGNASLVAADIDGGSIDDCGTVSLSASQTTFDCSNIFGSPAANLVITGVYDGPLTGGVPKGVELYVLADIADLSLYGVGSANNGQGSNGIEFTFPAVSVTAGTFITVASEAPQFTNYFGVAPDYTDTDMGVNGDDAIELFFNGSVIDVFGEINVDGTGQPWEYLDGWVYRNNNTGPDGSTFVLTNWTYSGINAMDNELTNATATTPFPVATYSYASAPGPNAVTLTVTDGSGNTSTCIANVTVSDTTSPVVTCPGNQTETPDAACQFTLPDYSGLATASDNCGSATLTQSPVAGTVISGTTTITMTATDASGNTSTCTFDVILSDVTPPTAVCQNINAYLNGAGNVTISAADLDGGSTDNCSGLTFSASQTAFTCADLGANNVTLTATDGNGNSASCTAVVTVLDTIAPVAICQNITVFLDGTGTTTINASDLDGGSVDNCGPVTFSASTTSFTCADIGANPVTLTVTDANGNAATCTSVVTVSDTVSPIAVCQNINVYLDGAGNATIVAVDLDGGSNDNCSTITLSASTTAFTCANTGANNVTLTATDDSGNSSTCTAVVTVIDTISPTAVCQNINAYLDGAGNAIIVAADLDGGSTDNCGAITLSASSTAFTCADLGANNVTLTVTDAGGNTSTCTAVVTILDTIAPTVTCPGNQLETPNASCQFALPDYTGLAIAADNCGVTTITQSPLAGTVIAGTTTITMTANDGNGNTSFCSFDVILNDATPPTAVCQNINVYLDAAGNATIGAADLDGGSTDNCSGLTFSASQTAFTCTNIGPNNVTLTVTDGNANSSTCVAVVTVLDTISPVVTCPGDQTELASATCDFLLPDYTGLAIGTDNCSGVISFTQSPAAGTSISANQVITITGTDANGNSATCTFNVILDQSACAGIECANAIVVGPLDPCGDQTTVTGSTVGGTPSTEVFCGTSLGSGGANWYTFTGDGGTWTASTLNPGSNYDTKIWVYEGLCGSLNCVTGNDDFGGTPQSQVSFATTLGATYYVVIGGYSANEGNYAMTISNMETTAPVISCPGDQTETVSATCDFTLPDYTGLVIATDNCGTPTVAQSPAAGTVITADQIITMTATDATGNTSTCTFNVLLIGGTPPVAVCQDVTIYLDAAGNATIAATDIDGGSAATCGTPTLSASETTFTCADLGANSVTLTVTDGGGNTDNCTATVTVIDTLAPTPDMATLPNVTAECEVTTLTDPTAIDNCGAVTVTNDAVLPIATQGTTVVTWTFDDGNGNTSTQTQNVVINDVSSPLPTAAPLADVTAECSVDTAPAAPTAIDACTGTITGVLTSSAFPYTTQGTHVIVWTFDDGNGNITTQSQNIVINDVTAPVPNTATLATLNGDCSIAAPSAPTATDNCVGTITGTTSTVFPITAIGTTTITWEFVDGNGNVSTQTQTAINTGIDASATISGDGGTITATVAGASYAWLNCVSGASIAGETDQSYTPAVNGTYAVIVTQGNCSDTSDCFTVSTAGINDLSMNNVVVYPNPSVDGYFTLSTEGTIEAIDVVDMLGRIIELPTDVNTGIVDGSELSQGRYMIRVRTNNTVLTAEIVIAR